MFIEKLPFNEKYMMEHLKNNMRRLVQNSSKSKFINLSDENLIQEVVQEELVPSTNINHDYNLNDNEINQKISRFYQRKRLITLFLVIRIRFFKDFTNIWQIILFLKTMKTNIKFIKY